MNLVNEIKKQPTLGEVSEMRGHLLVLVAAAASPWAAAAQRGEVPPNRQLGAAVRKKTAEERLDAASLALANGARVNTRCPQFGWTALTYAAKWGDDALVALLLAQPGVKVDATCEEEGWSALGWAAAGGYVDVAKRLLSAGASPTAGRKNKTPVDVATKSNHAGVLALLETAIHHSNASRDLSESEI